MSGVAGWMADRGLAFGRRFRRSLDDDVEILGLADQFTTPQPDAHPFLLP
jgi:hypothetical protein